MIETLDDWNERLEWCGCCPMTGCPVPTMDCKSIQILVNVCGLGANRPTNEWSVPGCEYTDARYMKLVVDRHTYRSGVGGFTLQDTSTYFRRSDNVCTYTVAETDGWDAGEVSPGSGGITFSPTVYTQGESAGTYYFNSSTAGTGAGGVTWLSTYKVTYSEKVTDPKGDLDAAADGYLAAASADGGLALSGLVRGSNCAAEKTFLNYTTCGDLSPAEPRALRKRMTKFRFRIPVEHAGSYYKITYDVAEFPHDAGVAESYVSEDNVVEWTGPGDAEDAGDVSWFTPWATITPPTEPGERRVVNVRFICYRGNKFGAKPQVMGEAFTLPS